MRTTAAETLPSATDGASRCPLVASTAIRSRRKGRQLWTPTSASQVGRVADHLVGSGVAEETAAKYEGGFRVLDAKRALCGWKVFPLAESQPTAEWESADALSIYISRLRFCDSLARDWGRHGSIWRGSAV